MRAADRGNARGGMRVGERINMTGRGGSVVHLGGPQDVAERIVRSLL